MFDEPFESALEKTRQITITTIGRTTGRQISLPVWFVRSGESLCLLPVRGSDTNWYRNLRDAPTIRMRAGRAEQSSSVTPITDPAKVDEVVEAFRAKYGARDVKAYYSKTDVAVDVSADK